MLSLLKNWIGHVCFWVFGKPQINFIVWMWLQIALSIEKDVQVCLHKTTEMFQHV